MKIKNLFYYFNLVFFFSCRYDPNRSHNCNRGFDPYRLLNNNILQDSDKKPFSIQAFPAIYKDYKNKEKVAETKKYDLTNQFQQILKKILST